MRLWLPISPLSRRFPVPIPDLPATAQSLLFSSAGPREMAMHWIQSMERKIHSLPFLWVEEIATFESESSFAFPRRLGEPRSDASASFPEMELGEENIGSRLVDLPRLEREGDIK